jgi:hypothetical protein
MLGGAERFKRGKCGSPAPLPRRFAKQKEPLLPSAATRCHIQR